MYFVYEKVAQGGEQIHILLGSGQLPVWSGAWKEKNGKVRDEEMYGRDRTSDHRGLLKLPSLSWGLWDVPVH